MAGREEARVRRIIERVTSEPHRRALEGYVAACRGHGVTWVTLTNSLPVLRDLLNFLEQDRHRKAPDDATPEDLRVFVDNLERQLNAKTARSHVAKIDSFLRWVRDPKGFTPRSRYHAPHPALAAAVPLSQRELRIKRVATQPRGRWAWKDIERVIAAAARVDMAAIVAVAWEARLSPRDVVMLDVGDYRPRPVSQTATLTYLPSRYVRPTAKCAYKRGDRWQAIFGTKETGWVPVGTFDTYADAKRAVTVAKKELFSVSIDLAKSVPYLERHLSNHRYKGRADAPLFPLSPTRRREPLSEDAPSLEDERWKPASIRSVPMLVGAGVNLRWYHLAGGV